MTDGLAHLLRRDNILRLAEPFRTKFLNERIDEVASQFDVVLRRFPHPGSGPDGVAIIETTMRPVAIESLACSRPIRVWGSYTRHEERIVLINSNSELPEREIWWHEFYHILFSPRHEQRTAFTFHANYEYRKEERRADDFAAAVLIPSIRGLSSMEDIMDRYDVSKQLARHAMDLHAALNQL